MTVSSAQISSLLYFKENYIVYVMGLPKRHARAIYEWGKLTLTDFGTNK